MERLSKVKKRQKNAEFPIQRKKGKKAYKTIYVLGQTKRVAHRPSKCREDAESAIGVE